MTAAPVQDHSVPKDEWLTLQQVLCEERAVLRAGAQRSDSLADELARREHEPTPFSALCLSGGGVRSAVFCLGFIQGLAARGVLRRFDYLSTVSGGGYAGAAVMAYARHLRDEPDDAPDAAPQEQPIARVERRVAHRPGANGAFIEHLREYASYLTPRLGPTSPDAWTMLAIGLRNFMILWAALLPLLLLAMLLPQWYAIMLRALSTSPLVQSMATELALAACLGFGWCFVYPEYASARPESRLATTRGFFVAFLAPLVLSAILLQLAALAYAAPAPPGTPASWAGNLRGTALTWLPGLVAALAVVRIVVRARLRGPMSVWAPPLHFLGLAAGGLVFTTIALAWFVSVENEIGALNRGLLIGAGAMARPPEALSAAYLRATLYTVPLVVALWFVFDIVYLWIASTFGRDTDREYLGRLENFLLGTACTWLVVCALSFGRPAWLFSVGDFLPQAWRPVVLLGLVAACIAVLAIIGTAWLSAPTHEIDPNTPDGRKLRRQARVAAAAAAVLLAVLAAFLAHAGVWLADPQDGIQARATRFWSAVHAHLSGVVATKDATPGDAASARLDDGPGRDWNERFGLALLQRGTAVPWTIMFASIAVFALLASRALRINRFSLHELYRSRLVRTFLGAARVEPAAGNPPRAPHPFTGFDADDNPRLHELQGLKPMLVVNTALNLSGSSKLSWQERKAAPFSLTPHHCGSLLAQVGFRRSVWYGSRETIAGDQSGISLGSAIAVSGAATSPNMGYNTSPLLAVVLTLFNLRLGLWLGNPMSSRARALLTARRPRAKAGLAANAGVVQGFAAQPCASSAADALDRVGKARRDDAWPALNKALDDDGYKLHRHGNPTLAAWPLVRELVGFSNERGAWINLSDGGHFDNLGVYEMILRRCRFLVCVDMTCDPKRDLHHLARVIRLLSVDLGVEIAPLSRAPAGTDKPSPFALYRIDYPPAQTDRVGTQAGPATGDGGLGKGDGLLLLVKPSLCGDEPPDVASYARAHPDFPNESTQDQFFGESQFESYRRLGLHLAQRLLDDPPSCGGRAAAAELIEQVLGTQPRR